MCVCVCVCYYYSCYLSFFLLLLLLLLLFSFYHLCVCECTCACVRACESTHVDDHSKLMCRFSKNILVAEKSQCKALLIGRHLEISLLLLMSAENIEMLTFVSLKLCFLGFCPSS